MMPGKLIRAAGIMISIIAVLGIVHGVRAGIAQALFLRAKYHGDDKPADSLLRMCSRAEKLYPWNYGLCLFAANTAMGEALKRPPRQEELFAGAEKWCDAGLALNPRDRRLVYDKVALLGAKESGRRDALAMWNEYTDWDFWNADNHFVLGLIYVSLGDLAGAEKEAFWAKGSERFAELDAAITSLKARKDPGSNSGT